jgi:(1->4)-alpha-D-glucan 1-alpha-D-glucosylmutase
MAKGVEDTAFYRQYPLASLNEVGGDPECFGLDVDSFHAKVLYRSLRWPHSMLATSTHDTKRSEDVRARINVLSEVPEEWAASIQRWAALNEHHRRVVDGALTPDRQAEYLLYQTLVGIWPSGGLTDAASHERFLARIQNYMEKALHEAKLRTSWINPNAGYEQAVRDFIEAILRPAPGNEFLPDIERFSRSIHRAGLWNSLSQTVLKWTCPGVPDLYQGNELWTFRLVDPDNRGPVDYDRRQALLDSLPPNNSTDRSEWLREAARNPFDGRLKLYVTATIARFRRANASFFEEARYLPLAPAGKSAEHVIAFARSLEGRNVVVAVSRFFLRLGCREEMPTGARVWEETRVVLPDSRDAAWCDLLSGKRLHRFTEGDRNTMLAADVFAYLPAAVIVDSVDFETG